MPEIQAFRGVRYDLGHVGSLSDVVAPPYDVIAPELQNELYQKHPCNFVRLELNRIEPGDDEANNRYTRAARFYKSWRSQGVLFQEADPAIYVYHQEFQLEGRTCTRRGFMARMRLSRFGEGQVFPHEQTMSAPKFDRLMLTVVTKANLSQIFGLYPDPGLETDAILERAIAGCTPLEAVDHLGVIHRMWPVTDVATISAVAARMSPKPIFIADGHHRYETACKYKEETYESGFLKPDHPANYVLMMFVAMEDPGLAILPTHRLFKDVPALTADDLTARLGDWFQTRPVAKGPGAAREVWEDLQILDSQGTLALYTQKDQQWTIAEVTPAGRAKMDELAIDHVPEWRELGVSLLHRLIVETGIGQPKPGGINYVHLVDELIGGLETGQYPLAALVMPATVEHVRAISLQGDRMPAKSTYFYPKLLSGLVVNPLE
ncbi:MAG: DUF1015 domain-containing protein [Thermoguttaceae bacterium]|nr:DUF1015 domain-containing protein [Thermoguttaceae bacterium]